MEEHALADNDPAGSGLQRLKWLAGWVFLFGGITLIASAVDPAYLNPNDKKFIFLIGTLGLWRYGNAIMHYLRGMYFLYWRFPRMRRAVDKLGDKALPSKAYMVVTSFRIPAHTTFKVYRSVFREVSRLSIPATVVVSIVERGDELLIRQIMHSEIIDRPDIDLIIVRTRGTGKRDGLAHAFRALARTMPEDDAVVGVVDGDTVLLPGCVENAVKFFSLLPTVGGITTNEFCEVEGSKLIKEWHTMRFVQRHINMCSMALSKRVLTMTGRLSFFRASILAEREFIRDVEADYLEHWRLGRFRFLTGDDKSSWFSLMRSGWDTFYVPDSCTLTVEHPPDNNFFKATRQLMFRWYGNSLRQNFRATKLLGRRRLGLFTLYVLYDQRISMWTCLLGLSASIVAALFFGLEFFIVYLFWVVVSRTIATILYGFCGHPVHPVYPLVLYYNQVIGSVMKVYALFHLDQQSWTRQKTRLDNLSGNLDLLMNRYSSKAMLASSISIFFGAVALLVNFSQG
jgi:glycosyltransferase Alg8